MRPRRLASARRWRCSSSAALAASLLRACARRRRRQPRADPGLRLELGGQRGQPVGRRRQLPGDPGRLHARRRRAGPPGLRQHRPRTSPSPRSATRGRPGHRGSPTPRRAARYAYLPIAAGGTSFPYHDRDRRPAGQEPPALGPDPGQDLHQPDHQLGRSRRSRPTTTATSCHPSRSSPVVQSEGSGATAQLTRYFATEYPSIWQAVLGLERADRVLPAPGRPDRPERLERGDELRGLERGQRLDRLRRVLLRAQRQLPGGQGAQRGRLLHAAHAVQRRGGARGGAINMDPSSPDYLLQNLDNVYTDPDPRTYPLSSYVYVIEPTGADPRRSKMTTAKRQSIADFLYYSICQGQREIGPIGYSPLPVNLVEAGFGQIAQAQDRRPGRRPDQPRTSRPATTRPSSPGNPNANYLATDRPDAAAVRPDRRHALRGGDRERPNRSPGLPRGSGVARPRRAQAAPGSGGAGVPPSPAQGQVAHSTRRPASSSRRTGSPTGTPPSASSRSPTPRAETGASRWRRLALVALAVFLPTFVGRRLSRRRARRMRGEEPPSARPRGAGRGGRPGDGARRARGADTGAPAGAAAFTKTETIIARVPSTARALST